MTYAEKIAQLRKNIASAEAAYRREVENGNDFACRMQIEFAEQCLAEIARIERRSEVAWQLQRA